MKRILILGDKYTGKSTFLSILVKKELNDDYEQTLGISAAARTIQFPDHSFINVQIWDTSGQPDYMEMAYPFYNNCKAFIVLVDRSDKKTLHTLQDWIQRIQQHSTSKTNNVLVILNKIQDRIEFNKQTFDKEYQKLTVQSQYRFLNIATIEIDLLKQRQVLQNKYIKPYLYEHCKEQIVIEVQNSQREVSCSSKECAIM